MKIEFYKNLIVWNKLVDLADDALLRNLKNKKLQPSPPKADPPSAETFNPQPKSGGQVMLITSLVLASTLLASTTIAGLLMLYQLRQGTDVANSTKAIYAADAGLEWRLYRFLKIDNRSCCSSGEQCQEPEFSNGATVKTTCASQPDESNQAVTIRSTGIVQKNARAFEFNFTSSN